MTESGLNGLTQQANEAAVALQALKGPAEETAASIEAAFGKAGESLTRSLSRAAKDGEISLGELASALINAVNAAGGVSGGGSLSSVLRGITTTRSDTTTYPSVAQLKALAAEVRAIVGPETKLSYAADWSEYFGHHTGDHAVFHLDPLWADTHIDFVGIDWYAPLTDWRKGEHLDAEEAASIYDPAYLASRVRGGEGFDWYYASPEDRDGQVRSSIADGAFGEHWMFRPKDIQGWWANPHHDRPGGVRQSAPTPWGPQSKPIRFIEYGCGAIDKGPNAPNLFVDPKSSESAIPPYSTGERDDRAQRSYLTALGRFYGEAANNPVSAVYGAPMLSGMDVWCWDARPYPDFPRREDVWGDGGNWRTGHWLNGRVGSAEAKHLLSAIAAQADAKIDVSQVEGVIDGYVIEQPMTAARAIEPILSWLRLDLTETQDGLKVIGPQTEAVLSPDSLADHEREPVLSRRELIEAPSALTVRCYDLDRDYQVLAVHARSEVKGGSLMQVDLGLSLSAAQARDFADRTLNEMRSVREAVTLDLSPADVLRFETGDEVVFESLRYRVVEIDQAERPCLTLTPVGEPAAVIPYEPSGGGGVTKAILTGFYLLDLPGFGVEETNARPVLVATVVPFTSVDVYAGAGSGTLTLRGRVTRPASVGYTRIALPAGQSNKLNRPACLYIYLEGPGLQSRSEADVLEGANFICVMGTNGEWEIIQYLSAELTGPRQWRLRGLIRGQWGTRALEIAEGASVIHLSEVVRADVPDTERGLPRLWRAGLSGFGGMAEGAIDVETVWAGIGLRPRAPVHGRMRRQGAGWRLTWIRCARYGGDHLDYEPPLEDGDEIYRLRFYQGTELRREIEVTRSGFDYAAEAVATDYPGGFDALSRVEIACKAPTSGVGLALEMSLSA